MKVLHVIPSVGPQRGGPSVMVRTLASGLFEAGIQADVATTDDNGSDHLGVDCKVPILEDGVTYRYFSRQARFYTFSWPLSQWLARHVADYDLVHIHALFSFPAIAAAFWAGRRRVPYVIRPLGTLNRWGMQYRRPFIKGLSFRWIESRILRHAAFIHYTSEQERLEASQLGVTSRSEIIPNALDCMEQTGRVGDFRSRYPQLRGRQIVLFLSRLDAKKGLDLLLPAFAKVVAQCPTAVLVLAGSGDPALIESLKHEIIRLGISSDVLWTGMLTGKDKHSAFADAEVFVLPSYSENFGIAAVEAMAAGLPIVISNQVAICDEVAEANAGVVVPCCVNRISEALLELLCNPAQRSELGRNGGPLVKKLYSRAAVTRQLIQLYDDVIQAKPLQTAAHC